MGVVLAIIGVGLGLTRLLLAVGVPAAEADLVGGVGTPLAPLGWIYLDRHYLHLKSTSNST